MLLQKETVGDHQRAPQRVGCSKTTKETLEVLQASSALLLQQVQRLEQHVAATADAAVGAAMPCKRRHLLRVKETAAKETVSCLLTQAN